MARRTWDGGAALAGLAAKFSVVGRGACALTITIVEFFEVDTGNQFNWTQTISD
jgi:hypothetical protein